MSYSTSSLSLTLHVILYLALASVPFTASLDPTCHYPDGTVALTDIPCNNHGSAAACCGPNYYCLSNGLCWGDLHLGRGSCTDPTWQAPGCAELCRNGKFINALLSDALQHLYLHSCWKMGKQLLTVAQRTLAVAKASASVPLVSFPAIIKLAPSRISQFQICRTSSSCSATISSRD